MVLRIGSTVYDFPIRPDTPEWQNLKSYEDRLNAYNIPEKLLKNMSTQDLVLTCLNYPEFRLIMTRNSLQQGYDYLKTIFNGFNELEKRKDAGIELLKEYIKLKPFDIINYETAVKRGEFAFKLTYIEVLLAQRPILLTLDGESKKDLLRVSISNYDVIERMPENYATFGLITPVFVLGRLLDANSQQDFVSKKLEDNNLRWFIDNAELLDAATLTNILTYSKVYLKQLDNE